jgi:1,4-dihydroxy-2-naphthoate octaprenyltransferase
MVLFFVTVGGLVAAGVLGVFSLLALFAIPTLRKVLGVYNRPKPEAAPKGYPLWPPWYVSWAFVLTRTAGAFFVVGLALDAIFPISF